MQQADQKNALHLRFASESSAVGRCVRFNCVGVRTSTTKQHSEFSEPPTTNEGHLLVSLGCPLVF